MATIKFGYLYTDDGMTVYDVTREVRHGRTVYVACLSASPTVNFAAVSEAGAVEQLKAFVYHRAWYNGHQLPAHSPISA